MKNLITFLLGQILLLTTAFAQQPDANARLTANHLYDINFKGYINYNITLVGKSPVLMLRLESAGMKMPMNVVETTNIKAQATTGTADASGQIPLSFKYIQAKFLSQNSNPQLTEPDDDKISALTGQMVQGKVSAKGKIKIDSATDVRITQSDINRQDMINIFHLPQISGKKLEVGNSYTTTDEVELMEMMDTKIKVGRKTTFKLLEITGNKAYFDVSQKVSGNFTNDIHFKSQLSGSGTGKLTFDLDAKMPVEFINDLKIKLSMPFTDTDAMEITYQSMSNNMIGIK